MYKLVFGTLRTKFTRALIRESSPNIDIRYFMHFTKGMENLGWKILAGGHGL